MTDFRALVATKTIEEGDCLIWQSYCYNGHPGLAIDGQKLLVRRALWIEANGQVPRGKVLRCTCGTPKCVNLDHVKPMTFREIALIDGARGLMSGPLRSAKIAAVKRAGKQARITQDDARAIRASDDTGKVLAQRYGLSPSTISKIRLGHVRREFNSPWAGLGGRV